MFHKKGHCTKVFIYLTITYWILRSIYHLVLQPCFQHPMSITFCHPYLQKMCQPKEKKYETNDSISMISSSNSDTVMCDYNIPDLDDFKDIKESSADTESEVNVTDYDYTEHDFEDLYSTSSGSDKCSNYRTKR